MFNKRASQVSEGVIVGNDIVDVAALRAEASRAGTRFWVLLVVVSLLSSMVMPYLSMASIVASDSKVFDGEVIPGYSMGGIDIASYGVDINKWGQSDATEDSPKMVRSTYGYWNTKRAEDAESNLKASIDADKEKAESENAVTPLADYEIQDEMMSDEDKAKAWIGITRDDGEGHGLSDFRNNPSGVEPNSDRYNYSEGVAPYRTQEDWKFWDSQTVGGQNTSMTTTIYPDFVIFGWDEKKQCARVLTNPDAIQSISEDNASTSMVMAGTSAVPHYVPLSTLFEAYGISDTVMNENPELGMNDMDTLLDAIDKDAKANDGKSPILNKIVKNESNEIKNDLLLGTHYENLNQGKAKSGETRDEATDAWNPYPYSMVFTMGADNNNVVSSIYNNTEAYVYMSPRSVYNNYLALRQEYDALVGAGASQIADEQPQSAFQLGYYLAGMAILEAYLNEALPQDMTRGYVGPAEGNPKATTESSLSDAKKLLSRSDEDGTVYKLFPNTIDGVSGMVASDIDATSAEDLSGSAGFKTVAYSQLMYDFADAAIFRNSPGGEVYLGTTSAIMNSLSTYGYGVLDGGMLTNTDKASAGQGPNRGMSRRANMSRVTNFGPYQKGAEDMTAGISKDEEDPLLAPTVENVANTGFYVPVYYPIQQHEMPADPEMRYRFQLLSLIPYPTLTYELGQHKFNGDVTLSYSNLDINTLDATERYYSKVASLAQQFEDMSDDSQALSGYDEAASIVLNPEAVAQTVNEQATNDYASRKDTTARVDNALMAFANGRMNSDNVHDLVDVARAIPGVKYETFVRYFNPIKSAGGADDLFLTRISPAQTAYMPGMLTKGYESAGGVTNNESIAPTSEAAFDYFSVPSFAPCFAAHTAENTYYGAMSYELRGFYTRGFLSGLPAAANVPALEKYEQAKEEKEEVEASTSIPDIKKKMLTIYVLAKRLAYASAYSKIKAAQGGGDGSVQLGPLYHSDLTTGSNLEPTWSEVAAALTPADDDKYIGAENDKTEGASSKTVEMTVATADDNSSSAASSSSSSSDGSSAGGSSDGGGGEDGDGGGGEDGDGGDGGDGGGGGGVSQANKDFWQGLRNVIDWSMVGSGRSDSRAYAQNSDLDLIHGVQKPFNAILNYFNNKGAHGKYAQRLMEIKKSLPNGGAKHSDFYEDKGWFNIDYTRAYKTRDLLNEIHDEAYNSKYDVTVNLVSPLARAVPIDSGDYIEATTYKPSSQLTAYYDNGDGTAGVVSYARMPDGRYEPQAGMVVVESDTNLPQPTPASFDAETVAAGESHQVATTDQVNGIPVSGVRIEEYSPYAQSGNTPTNNQIPKQNNGAQSYNNGQGVGAGDTHVAPGSPAASPPSADAKNDKDDDKGKDDDKNGSKTSNKNGTPITPSKSSTPKKTADPEAIDGYPVNEEAKKVYKKDSLASKSYNCSPQATWGEMAGKHNIGDSIKFHIPSDFKLPTGSGFDFVMQQFGVKHALGDDATLKKNVIWCSDAQGNAFVTNLRTLFAGLYRQEFNALLTGSSGSAGTYFWEPASKIAEVVGDAQFDSGDMKDEEKTQWNTVAMDYGAVADAGGMQSTLDEYCNKAFGEAGACLAAMKALNDEMPEQMQNCLAWADTQSASESELNYTVDPEDANNTIVFRLSDDEDDASLGIIRNIDDLDRAGFVIATNNGDWAAVPKVDAGMSETKEGDLQARMARGVADTTFTATNQLAAYTISSTVSRINTLVTSNSSSSSIPYSGVYTGVLMAGTERYSQMQAHSLDTASIVSGLSGDLRRRSTGNRTQVKSDNVDADTQAYFERQGQVADEMYMSLETTLDMATTSVDSLSPQETTSKAPKDDTNSSKTATAAPLNLSGIFSGGGTSREMADASSFENVSMNRRSARTQRYDKGANMVVLAGSMAQANATSSNDIYVTNEVSEDAHWAKSLIGAQNGSGLLGFDLSGAYALVQSVALLLVLVFLMIIAFQNFVGYVSGDEAGYIAAQTHLKTVLPRTLIAIAMIGLPPLAGGTGFQGGGFLLLEVLHSLLNILMGVFLPHDPMSMVTGTLNECLDKIKAGNLLWDLLLDIVKFLIGLAVALISWFISIMCLAENVFLFLFWLLGPLFWAFYVWPYNKSGESPPRKGFGKLMDSLTAKMGSKTFTNGQVGNEAPSGLVYGYIDMLMVIVKWQLLMWAFAIVLAMTFGTGGVAGALSQGGIPTSSAASDDNLSSALFDVTEINDTANPGTIWIPIAATALYGFLAYRMFKSISKSAPGALGGLYRGVGAVMGTAASFAVGGAMGKVAGLAGKATTALKAKGGALGKVGKVMEGMGKLGQAVKTDINTSRALKRAQQGQEALNNLIGAAGGTPGDAAGALGTEDRQAAAGALGQALGLDQPSDRMGLGTYHTADGQLRSQSATANLIYDTLSKAGKNAKNKGILKLEQARVHHAIDKGQEALDKQKESLGRLEEQHDELRQREGLYQLGDSHEERQESLAAREKGVRAVADRLLSGDRMTETDMFDQIKELISTEGESVGALSDDELRHRAHTLMALGANSKAQREQFVQDAREKALAEYDELVNGPDAPKHMVSRDDWGAKAESNALASWNAKYADRQNGMADAFVSDVFGDARELLDKSSEDAEKEWHDQFDNTGRKVATAQALVASGQAAQHALEEQGEAVDRAVGNAFAGLSENEDGSERLAVGAALARDIQKEAAQQSHDVRTASDAAIRLTENDEYIQDVGGMSVPDRIRQQQFNQAAGVAGRMLQNASENGAVDQSAAYHAQQSMGAASRSAGSRGRVGNAVASHRQLNAINGFRNGVARASEVVPSPDGQQLLITGANNVSMAVPAVIDGAPTSQVAARALGDAYAGYMGKSGQELVMANRAMGLTNNLGQHMPSSAFTATAIRSGFSLTSGGSPTNSSSVGDGINQAQQLPSGSGSPSTAEETPVRQLTGSSQSATSDADAIRLVRNGVSATVDDPRQVAMLEQIIAKIEQNQGDDA